MAPCPSLVLASARCRCRRHCELVPFAAQLQQKGSLLQICWCRISWRERYLPTCPCHQVQVRTACPSGPLQLIFSWLSCRSLLSRPGSNSHKHRKLQSRQPHVWVFARYFCSEERHFCLHGLQLVVWCLLVFPLPICFFGGSWWSCWWLFWCSCWTSMSVLFARRGTLSK